MTKEATMTRTTMLKAKSDISYHRANNDEIISLITEGDFYHINSFDSDKNLHLDRGLRRNCFFIEYKLLESCYKIVKIETRKYGGDLPLEKPLIMPFKEVSGRRVLLTGDKLKKYKEIHQDIETLAQTRVQLYDMAGVNTQQDTPIGTLPVELYDKIASDVVAIDNQDDGDKIMSAIESRVSFFNTIKDSPDSKEESIEIAHTL
jgi:hypothetical protein